jgi:hypothetical protein
MRIFLAPILNFVLFHCFVCIFFGVLECVGHSYAYTPIHDFLRDVWIQIQSAAVAS